MSVEVYIPTPFRRATGGRDRVSVDAVDVRELVERLEAEYGGLRGLVRDDQGAIHPHVNVYVNNEEIDALGGLDTPLADGDEVSIIPALAGGAAGRFASPGFVLAPRPPSTYVQVRLGRPGGSGLAWLASRSAARRLIADSRAT